MNAASPERKWKSAKDTNPLDQYARYLSVALLSAVNLSFFRQFLGPSLCAGL